MPVLLPMALPMQASTGDSGSGAEMTTWHERRLVPPPLDVYLLCYYAGGNWLDNDDPNYIVAKATKHGADEHNNRGMWYRWETFGPLKLFAHDVSYWAEISRLSNRDKGD